MIFILYDSRPLLYVCAIIIFAVIAYTLYNVLSRFYKLPTPYQCCYRFYFFLIEFVLLIILPFRLIFSFLKNTVWPIIKKVCDAI